MSRIFCAALLIEAATVSKDPVDILSAKRWCHSGLVSRSTVFPGYADVTKDGMSLTHSFLQGACPHPSFFLSSSSSSPPPS